MAVALKLAVAAEVTELVRVMTPAVAPAGTTVKIVVSLMTLNGALVVVPVNLTDVTALKPVPVIVTEVPTPPEVGAVVVTLGGIPTAKEVALAAVALPLMTVIVPEVAPLGTVAVMLVADTTVNVVALTPLNFTAVAPVKLVPVSVTTVATGPAAGVKEVTPRIVITAAVLLAAVPTPLLNTALNCLLLSVEAATKL